MLLRSDSIKQALTLKTGTLTAKAQYYTLIIPEPKSEHVVLPFQLNMCTPLQTQFLIRIEQEFGIYEPNHL